MTSTNHLKLGLIQHACPPQADKAAILDQACDMIRQAADRGATLIVTQELFSGIYFPQTEQADHFALAEPIPGPTTQRLAELARELNIHLAASLFERRAAGVYHNTSVLLDPAGQIVARYRKMHIPDDPGFYEKYYFTPGDCGWQVHQAGNVNVGMLICWDQWYPEAARLTAMRGAQVLLYPTAIGWSDDEPAQLQHKQIEAWKTIQRSHAIANGLYVAAINRIGTEGHITFWGSSFICDPMGHVLAQAPTDQPAVLVAELDLALIEQTRQAWPFFRDRRIDAYQELTQRWHDAADEV